MMKTQPCPRCDLMLTTAGATVGAARLKRHLGSERCNARVVAAQVRKRGLIPVELKTQNIISNHVAAALKLFELPNEIHPTRAAHSAHVFRGSSKGNQAWTNAEGVTLADVINAVAKTLSISFPEAARRLHANQRLIKPFDSARRLGAEHDVLRDQLRVIDYVLGSDGKPRPTPTLRLLPVAR